MKGQSLVFNGGRLVAGLNRAHSGLQIEESSQKHRGVRCLSTTCTPRQRSQQVGVKPKGKEPKHDKFANRDFFLSILGSTTTKRDTRAYIKHFTSPKEQAAKTESTLPQPAKDASEQRQQHGGVNLGRFYASRAVDYSPQFVQEPYAGSASRSTDGPKHVALVKIRAPQEINDETLDGVARTLAQLAKLGMVSTVVVDCADHSAQGDGSKDPRWKDIITEQVDRIVAAIDAHSLPGARKEENILGVFEKDALPYELSASFGGRTHVRYRNLLITPLSRGIIPVVACIGYTDVSQQAVPVNADEVVLALTREFAGLGFTGTPSPEEDPKETAERMRILKSEVSLDRLIVLDPLGGIPTSQRPNGYHVFLNMEQEYPIVKNDLLTTHGLAAVQESLDSSKQPKISDLGNSNPMSQFVETEFGTPMPTPEALAANDLSQALPTSTLIHLQNLELVRRVLSFLPSTSSAVLTTPTEAANSGNRPSPPTLTTGVGTRSQRNPLIHNLLTDKPVISSSLPAGRLVNHGTQSPTASPDPCRTTFAKRGMSVSIFPDPRHTPWAPPVAGRPQLSLTDPRIDLPRLVHLINDSFDRALDVPAYLARVNARVAGVIIAGEYDGGALLTWELPPGIDPASPEAEGRWVPYLDKFAVLKRSQGSGGVADVVFKAMVRDCFPGGVCWRSRTTNPVNKWYFERSRGTWRLPGSNWTMFWTTEGVEDRKGLFEDYEAVCESIGPTWAEVKDEVD